MYLLDTNIILELLLDQEKADDVERLLRDTQSKSLYLSDFSLYSLGTALLRRNMYDTFLQSVDDLLVNNAIRLVRIQVSDVQDIVHAARRFNLDFDDAYQYVVAGKYNLTIVSFDSDFDRTDTGRQIPAELAQG